MQHNKTAIVRQQILDLLMDGKEYTAKQIAIKLGYQHDKTGHHIRYLVRESKQIKMIEKFFVSSDLRYTYQIIKDAYTNPVYVKTKDEPKPIIDDKKVMQQLENERLAKKDFRGAMSKIEGLHEKLRLQSQQARRERKSGRAYVSGSMLSDAV